MKRNSLFAVFLFLAAQPSLAFEYKISCADQKITGFQNLNANTHSSECKAFLANGFTRCFDSSKPNKSSEALTLSMPNDHYYQSKESTRYSRKSMQEIIDSAIKAGNDPYLTLSIVITENPPLIGEKKSSSAGLTTEMYVDTYGKIPLDAIAVADTMACDRVQTGYGSDGLMHLKNRGKLKTFVVDPKGVERTVCIDNQFMAGQGASFWLEDNPRTDDCCMKLKADPNGFTSLYGPVGTASQPHNVASFADLPLKHKILDLFAQQYMLNRFAAAKKRADQVPLPEGKMAMIAQSYNGYGQFGASEPMNNRCLHKIQMGKSPVYGAGTSEIMLNSLMNNSEIVDMVTESLKKHKKDYPVSYLCSSYGQGIHQISGYAFTNLLSKYIGERKMCPQFTNKLKKLSQFAQAKSAHLPNSNSDTKNSTPADQAN